jgi:O-succinylbenzoate synthase
MLAVTVAAMFLVLYDVDLLRHHLPDVQGNLEASVIWGTPTAIAFFWRAEHRHRQRMAHLDSLHAKVDQLHQHLGVEQPTD